VDNVDVGQDDVLEVREGRTSNGDGGFDCWGGSGGRGCVSSDVVGGGQRLAGVGVDDRSGS